MSPRRRADRLEPKRRWRDYKTPAGNRPVVDFLDGLGDNDAAAILAAMKVVERIGTASARHLEDEIFEVRAEGDRQTFRILFATEGEQNQVLLSLVGFSKKTQKTPRHAIELAKHRLRDWRSRGRSGSKGSD